MEEFFSLCYYVKGSYDKKKDFEHLGKELDKFNCTSGNRIFYLALPPSVFKETTTLIKACCMSKKYVKTTYYKKALRFNFGILETLFLYLYKNAHLEGGLVL